MLCLAVVVDFVNCYLWYFGFAVVLGLFDMFSVLFALELFGWLIDFLFGGVIWIVCCSLVICCFNVVNYFMVCDLLLSL